MIACNERVERAVRGRVVVTWETEPHADPSLREAPRVKRLDTGIPPSIEAIATG